MTLEEKIAFCTGVNFWETKAMEKYGIPALFMSDGPHGLRKQNLDSPTDMLGVNKSEPATCFPAEVTSAGSWDVELMEKIGAAIADEARNKKVGLVLGPGANIKRNPLCGRNFEYFSEDPYLAGKMAAGFIKGMEGKGIASSLKHFACNSQENDRYTSDGILDERTLREIYLAAFEIAVKEGRPSTVMCAYPKINGIHCSDNKKLLTDILRQEWGFDGMVVTDWGAMSDRIKAFEAGCDLNMPGGNTYMEKETAQAIAQGKLDEAYIDASVERISRLAVRAQDSLSKAGVEWDIIEENNHRLAVEAAVSGAVLLKNQDEVLPLDIENEKIGIVGYMARHIRYQGAGSSHINPTRVSNPLDYFDRALYAKGCTEMGQTSESMLEEVRRVASQTDKVLVFAGLPDYYESEGFDRDKMTMPQGHLDMINAALESNENVIVILLCGSVVECPWADRVKGILYMGLPGQGGGEAVYKLLTGKANPSGRLTESWPYTYTDVPSSDIYDRTRDALYEEGIYIGYRYYEKAGVAVRWPFGYGLSYTSFKYSDLMVQDNVVKVTVTNTGVRAGAEVVQLYIGKCGKETLHRPVRELKRFKKLHLQAGESREVEFRLDDRCFAVWQEGWKVERASYKVSVSNLEEEISWGSDAIAYEESRAGWYYTLSGKPDRSDWERENGIKYVEPVLNKGSFTMENTVEEMKDYSWIMKIMYKAVESTIAKQFNGKKDYDNPEFKMLMKSSAGSPMRSMVISGGINENLFKGMLDMANGHFFKGLKRVLSKN